MTPILESTIAANFSQALLVLVEGMLGIFIFMGVFYALIYSLELIFKEKKER